MKFKLSVKVSWDCVSFLFIHYMIGIKYYPCPKPSTPVFFFFFNFFFLMIEKWGGLGNDLKQVSQEELKGNYSPVTYL